MTTENLREFVLLAQVGNYAVAAEPLFISEATLSRHIMGLEKEVGAQLFIRHPRRIELTEAGHILLPLAREIIAEETALRTDLASAQAHLQKVVSIGLDGILSCYGVSQMIAEFQRSYPEYRIEVTELSSKSLRQQVSENKLQFAFIVQDEDAELTDYQVQPFYADSLAVVFSPKHPLASDETIHLSKLEGENLLLPPAQTSMLTLLERAFHDSGFVPLSTVSAHPVGQVSTDLIEAGFCVGIMPTRLAQTQLDKHLSARPIVPKIEIETAMIYNPNIFSPGSTRFLEYVERRLETRENGVL